MGWLVVSAALCAVGGMPRGIRYALRGLPHLVWMMPYLEISGLGPGAEEREER